MLCLPRDSITFRSSATSPPAPSRSWAWLRGGRRRGPRPHRSGSNVVKHSGADEEYEVRLIETTRCEISVVDTGQGFDSRSPSAHG